MEFQTIGFCKGRKKAGMMRAAVILRSTTTRAGQDRYRELKRYARRICRQKKNEVEMRKYEEFEKLVEKANAR